MASLFSLMTPNAHLLHGADNPFMLLLAAEVPDHSPRWCSNSGRRSGVQSAPTQPQFLRRMSRLISCYPPAPSVHSGHEPSRSVPDSPATHLRIHSHGSDNAKDAASASTEATCPCQPLVASVTVEGPLASRKVFSRARSQHAHPIIKRPVGRLLNHAKLRRTPQYGCIRHSDRYSSPDARPTRP